MSIIIAPATTVTSKQARARKPKPAYPTASVLALIIREASIATREKWEDKETGSWVPDEAGLAQSAVDALVRESAEKLGLEKSTLSPLAKRKAGRNVGGYMLPWGSFDSVPGVHHVYYEDRRLTRALRLAGMLGYPLPTDFGSSGGGYFTLQAAYDAYASTTAKYESDLGDWEAKVGEWAPPEASVEAAAV